MKRRTFLKQSTLTGAALWSGLSRPLHQEMQIEVLNPANRVPVSFIIDDSTALVNMAHFGIPQFKEVFPEQYRQNWRQLPREIPDAFVLEWLEWCSLNGVKGKYSMVPYPACTGWLHRFIPGWTKKELEDSLRIVRELAQPDWDIHSEMISHTRVIDIATGQPYAEASADYMENWEWSQTRSADELGAYIAYSLQVLKDAGLYCEGVTTPGGFGHRNIPNLARGTQHAVRDVYGVDVAHFFRDVITDPGKSVQPQVMHAENLDGPNASCSVHIIACTGDWFGGWDGLTPGDPDRFITADGKSGRMVEVLEAEEPAIFICHWPGIYYNGTKLGFDIFKTVVNRLHTTYDHLRWMKLSTIAHYWAAKEHTRFTWEGNKIQLTAPFTAEAFTLSIPTASRSVNLLKGSQNVPLKKVDTNRSLQSGCWTPEDDQTIVCIDLPKGQTTIQLEEM